MIWNTFPAIFVFGLWAIPLNGAFWPIWLQTQWITNIWNAFFLIFLAVESQMGLYYSIALFYTVSLAMDQRDVYIINNPDYTGGATGDTGELFSEFLGGVLTANVLDTFGIQHLPEVDHVIY